MTADGPSADEPATAAIPEAVSDDVSQASDGDASELAAKLPGLLDERPEIAAGLAFAGGVVLAMVIKRLAS